jgi:hypothetical protein
MLKKIMLHLLLLHRLALWLTLSGGGAAWEDPTKVRAYLLFCRWYATISIIPCIDPGTAPPTGTEGFALDASTRCSMYFVYELLVPGRPHTWCGSDVAWTRNFPTVVVAAALGNVISRRSLSRVKNTKYTAVSRSLHQNK